MPAHVVVIGAGVIGLSCAILLQEAGYAVTIVARDFPGPFETLDPVAQINYTSPWGGAHNRWVPPHASSPPSTHREHTLSLKTYAHMQRLHSSHPQTAGITFLKGIEYLESPGPEYLALDPSSLRLPGTFRLLPASQFPDAKVTWACEYDTWCVNPMVYCSFLLRRFVHRGGQTMVLKRELRSPVEAFSLPLPPPPAATAVPNPANSDAKSVPVAVSAVVNASGTGLVPDPAMTITRGQTCLVAESCDATVTRQCADGSWAFCVPRGFEGGTIIGGTRELDNWEVEPSEKLRERLLKRFAETYPRILEGSKTGRLTVLRDIVGRRPTRVGGPRIEGEVLGGEAGGFVMHAYGLGARGYELSWGVAEEVVEGVRRHLNAQAAVAAKL
ncbi:D-amino-acid oxidase [Madurella mycetomatis]|uniref:D-amino-acid oxidase n=1 Tax=Madurella mycetomatis TaxID=100816 RepID=A0A175WGX0_9PEZI|nr:D-amino-acid oxidase [Madurella mycetomatis]